MGETRICVQMCVYIAFFAVTVISVAAYLDEYGEPCPGPLEYYDALGCRAEYDWGDFCPRRYDCDHLRNRSKNKCYINGHKYRFGYYLDEEDANRCDFQCICRPGDHVDEIAAFDCIDIDCPEKTAKDGCYLREDPTKCCGDPQEICPKTPEDRPICIINNNGYQDGQHFEVKDEPDMICICRPGYDGRNIPPFCYTPKHLSCSHPAFHHVDHFHRKCAPIFLNYNKLSQNNCYLRMRCQNANDTVIRKDNNLKPIKNADEENVCLFGNLIMRIGDKLIPATDFFSVCVECICEVPPVPTCQYMTEKDCNSTNPPAYFYRYEV